MNTMNQHKKGYLLGSVTIEAVFIIPVVFYIILILIYMNFYLHDYNILVAKANYIIEKYIETEDSSLIQNDSLYQELNKGLWFSKADNISIDKSFLRLNLKADISLALPDTGIFGMFSLFGFNHSYEREFWILNRTETARIFTVGIDTLSRIEGVKEIIEKYIK